MKPQIRTFISLDPSRVGLVPSVTANAGANERKAIYIGLDQASRRWAQRHAKSGCGWA